MQVHGDPVIITRGIVIGLAVLAFFWLSQGGKFRRTKKGRHAVIGSVFLVLCGTALLLPLLNLPVLQPYHGWIVALAMLAFPLGIGYLIASMVTPTE